MKDHIVHVGVHKAGSTWLQRHLFPTTKGATYARGPIFSALLLNLVDEEDFYESTFRAALSHAGDRVLLSCERLAAGDPWGSRNHADRVADRLAMVASGARIILLTRNREPLVRSLYAQYVQEGGYVSRSKFEEFILASDYLNANKIVERYESRFQRVLVLSHEQLRAVPAECIKQIEEFAEIELRIPAATSANISLWGWRLGLLRGWNRVFRASSINSNPPLPIPYAGAMRTILQARWKDSSMEK